MTGTPGLGKAKAAVAAALLLAATAAALPSAGVEPQHSRNAIQTGDDLMDNIYTDCLNKGSVSCVKYKLFSFVDKVLSSKDSFSLTEGVTVVKTPGAVAADGAPRSLSADDIQKQDMDSLVANRMERFLSTHTLKLDLKGTEVLDAVSSAGRALGDAADSLGLTEEEDDEVTGRKKVKKAGKVLLPLLLMMKMKAAALIPIALGAIALIAGKALLIGKIALLLASIIGLKKLLSQQHKSVTYEIVSHPHHSSSHEHHHDSFSSGGGGDIGYGGGHGGWGRSGDGQEMAYRAYQHQPKTQ